MPNQRNVESLAALTERMGRMQFALVADYRGLTVAEMSDIRKQLRPVNGELIVAKNTLLRLAIKETGYTSLEPMLSGPTALVFGYDEAPKVAKIINDFVRATKKQITIKGGVLGRNPIAGSDLESVANMPTREQILAQVVGTVQSPLSGVVGVLNAALSNVVYTLQARIEQQEQQKAA